MQKLLEKNYQITLALIEHFSIVNNNNSISYFSDVIQKDPRTTAKILKNLEADIKENNWEALLTIDLSRNQVSAKLGKDFSLNFFYSFYMKKSLSFILCMEIFTNQYETIQAFSEKYYLSPATIYRRITPLKELLISFNLNLDLSTSHLIIGEEYQIRYFFYMIFWEINYTSEFFLKDDHGLATALHSINRQKFHFSETAIEKLELMMAISHFRNNSGFMLSGVLREVTSVNVLLSYNDFSEYMQKFFDHPALQLVENDCYFIYLFMTATDIYAEELFENVDASILDFTDPQTQLAQDWIKHLVNFLDLQLPPGKYFYLLFNLINIHLRTNIFSETEISFDFSGNHAFLNNAHPYTTNQTDLFFKYLMDKLPIELDNNLRFFYTLLLRNVIDLMLPPLNILVLSKVNCEQQHFFQRRIKQHSFVPVTFDYELTNQTDLVISDTPLDYKKLGLPIEKHFQWQSFPSVKEWAQLMDIMEKIFYAQNNDDRFQLANTRNYNLS